MIFVVVMWLALASYVQLVGDDYAYLVSIKKNGLLGAMADMYQTWSGRYIGNSLSFLTVKALELGGGWAQMAMVTTVFGFFALGIQLCFREFVQKSWQISCFLTFALFLMAEDINTALFWSTGLGVYTIATGCFFYLLAAALRVAREPNFVSTLWLMAAMILCFGAFEYTCLASLITGGFLLIHLWIKQKWRWHHGLLPILGLVLLWVVFVASGNDSRMSEVAFEHRWTHIAFRSMLDPIIHSWQWGLELPFLVSIVLFKVYAPTLLERGTGWIAEMRRYWWSVFIMGSLGIFLMFLSTWIAQQTGPFARSLSMIKIFFQIWVLILLLPWVFHRAPAWDQLRKPVLILAVFLIPTCSNVWQAALDVSLRAPVYAKQIQDNEKVFLNSETDIKVSAVIKVPYTFYYKAYSNNPGYYLNKMASEYYNCKSIKGSDKVDLEKIKNYRTPLEQLLLRR